MWNIAQHYGAQQNTMDKGIFWYLGTTYKKENAKKERWNKIDVTTSVLRTVFVKILKRLSLSLSLSADLCIHSYWLSQLKQASHRKMIQSSALRLEPSLSTQWSLVWSFIRDFFCISFVWLCSQRELSQTKLMQTMSRTKLCTRLHWLERLGFR